MNGPTAPDASSPSLREQLVAALEDYPVALWTPGNLASRLLNVAGADLEAGREAGRKVQRLDQMATAWKERLPETINRDTVVEAVHQVTRGGAG